MLLASLTISMLQDLKLERNGQIFFYFWLSATRLHQATLDCGVLCSYFLISALSSTSLLSALSLFLLVSLFQLMALPLMPSPKLETRDY